MNQSIAYELDAVMPAAILTGLLSSLCTIQQPDLAQDVDGSPLNLPATNVSGLVNIPCMDSVPSIARVQATEVKELADIMAKGLRHVLLNDWYPQILSRQWAVIDGVIYDILGVESDSQNQQTRLELQLVTL
jgi:hypothetical protein